MTKPRKAPTDAPSTLVDPEYAKRKRAERKAIDDRAASLAGPVTTKVITDMKIRYITIGPGLNAFGYAAEEVKSHVEHDDGDEPRGGADTGAGD